MIVVQLPVVIVVNPAIELYDQFEGNAGEVSEVAIDGVLAAKSETVEARGAERLP